MTYYHNRINFEVFHALTDGTGATQFLRELVKNYPHLAHQEDGLADVILTDEKVTIRDQEDDSFSKYYNPDMKRSKKKKPHAYQIKKMRKEYDELRVIEGTASVKDVLAVSREKGVSMTVLLTAVYLCAIQRGDVQTSGKAAGNIDGAGESEEGISIGFHAELFRIY
ncbi:MAG: hypothetical protein ACLTLQ_05750 [[Clostridium] scindens]